MGIFNISEHIDELNDNIQAYVKTMLEYYRLQIFKKAVQSSSVLIKLLVIGSIFLLFLGFLSVGAAIWIGKALGELSTGFFIIAGIYLLIFIIFFIFRKNLIDNLILQRVSKMVFDEDQFKDVVDEPLEKQLKNKQS